MSAKPGSPRKTHFSTSPPRRKRRRPQHKRLYCDCGQPAVTVLAVKVGSDPQYLVRLPLCQACLELEQSFRENA